VAINGREIIFIMMLLYVLPIRLFFPPKGQKN
jgi:hypothetical protein